MSDPLRPAEFIYSSIGCYHFTTERKEFPVQLHWHYFAEIIRVREGSLLVRRGEEDVHLSAGDAVLITPLVRHSLDYAEPGTSAEYDVIRLDMELFGDLPSYSPDMRGLLLEAERQGYSMVLTARELHETRIGVYLDMCFEESRRQDYGYDIRIRALLFLIFTTAIRRWIAGGFTPQDYGSRIDPIYTLPNYIAHHVEQPLKVEDLAAYCGLSYPWFARKFREIYGISCKEYIELIRIRRVEHYLQFTDCDLNYISAHTGYADCSHLVRDFRKLRNTTPGQFRQAARKKPQGNESVPQQFPQSY